MAEGSGIEIHQYQSSDLEGVKNLNSKAIEEFGDSFRRPTFPDLDQIENTYLNNNGDFLVATNEGKVIGMGALMKVSDDKAEVKRMRVSPDSQRQGLGKAILDRLEQRAKELGYKTLELDTSINQPAAQEFYMKNGYVEVRREGPEQGWPVDTIFYEKSL